MDGHVSFDFRPRPAHGRGANRLWPGFQHLRHRRFGAGAAPADAARRYRCEAVYAPQHSKYIVRREEPDEIPRRIRPIRIWPVSAGRRATLRVVRRGASHGKRHGFRRLAPEAHCVVQSTPGPARKIPGALEISAHRRIPGHQPRAVQTGEPARRRAQEPLRRGGRRPEHLRLSRSGYRQYPLFPPRLSESRYRAAGAELPLHGEYSPPGRVHHWTQSGPHRKKPVDGKRGGRACVAHRGGIGAGRGAKNRTGNQERARRVWLWLRAFRGVLPDQCAKPLDRGRAAAGGRSVPRRGRTFVLSAQGSKRYACIPAPVDQSRRSGQFAARDQLSRARHRGEDVRMACRLCGRSAVHGLGGHRASRAGGASAAGRARRRRVPGNDAPAHAAGRRGGARGGGSAFPGGGDRPCPPAPAGRNARRKPCALAECAGIDRGHCGVRCGPSRRAYAQYVPAGNGASDRSRRHGRRSARNAYDVACVQGA